MSEKKVCILRSNPVNPDSRVEKEALALTKAGYQVHILAWDRSSNHPEENSLISVGNFRISITRLGYKASFGEGIKNLKPYLKFQFGMRKYLRQHSFDVVHACDFDTAFFSHLLVRRKKEKFIFDIFDLICDDESTLFQKLVKKMQMRIINRADATIICTEERKIQIAKSNPRKLVIIHNSPSSEQFDQNKRISNLSSKVKVCYVGILQNGRLLKEIGEFFTEHQDFEFHIGGFGYLEAFFKNLCKENDNIHFYGKIPYSDTLSLENSCDVMLAIYDPALSNHRYAAPNKFYESLFLGKPVIMVKGTGMSEIVSAHQIGAVIDYSKESFSAGLSNIIQEKSHWEEISEKMKSIYNSTYAWSIMESRLIALYKELTE